MLSNKDDVPYDIWDKYYNDAFKGSKYVNCANCNVKFNANDIYIFSSVFSAFISVAINLTKDDIRFLHSNCFFKNCSNDKKDTYGGAIFCKCNSSIIQYRFCSTGCSVSTTKDQSHGAHSYCSLEPSHFNYVIESSVSSCIGESINSVLYFAEGNIVITQTNESKNVVKSCSGYNVWAENEGFANLSNFCDNQQPKSYVLSYTDSVFNHYLCNFINNPSTDTSIHIFVIERKNSIITFENCSFMRPYGERSIITIISLSYSPKVLISKCYVDDMSQISYFDPKDCIETSLTYKLQHLSTKECDAEFPFANNVYIFLNNVNQCTNRNEMYSKCVVMSYYILFGKI